ncbi:MAG TPA: alpha/beta fold hydrolase [Coleofasciculaceae cyanobacterium]
MPHHPYFFSPFQSHPDRPLFIFLPGMDETGKDLMTLQVAQLDTVFDVRCFVIPADTLDSWDALAQQLIALTQTELKKTPRQVYLCGESFGGCLVLNVLIQMPELFDRIILINPASSFHRILWLVLGSFLLNWTPQFFYDVASVLSLPFLSQLARLDATARQALMKAAQDAPKQTSEQRLELLRRFRIDEGKLQKIIQPVLLIGSQEDHLLPSVDEAHRLARLFPNAQVVILPDSGHACLVETDVSLVKILQDANFLLAP